MMTREAIQSCLSRRLIAKLATQGRDGFPHIVPVWFLWNNGRIFVATSRNSLKVRNIQRNDRVAVLLDSAVRSKVWGVLIRGRAQLLYRERASKLNRLIHAKYLGKKAMRDPKVVSYFAGDDATIVVETISVVSWDSRKSSIPTRGLAIQL